MATTGFWPVKSRLKEVIEYARNPRPRSKNIWMRICFVRCGMLKTREKPTGKCLSAASTALQKEPMSI